MTKKLQVKIFRKVHQLRSAPKTQNKGNILHSIKIKRRRILPGKNILRSYSKQAVKIMTKKLG